MVKSTHILYLNSIYHKILRHNKLYSTLSNLSRYYNMMVASLMVETKVLRSRLFKPTKHCNASI